jgi:hypothetical protein
MGSLLEADGTVIDVLKVAVFVLVVQLVMLGLTLGMPIAGTSMCPETFLMDALPATLGLLSRLREAVEESPQSTPDS